MGFWDKAREIAGNVARATVKAVAVAMSVMADIGEKVVKSVSRGLKRVKNWANGKLGVQNRAPTPVARTVVERPARPSREEELKKLPEKLYQTVRLFHDKLEQLSETSPGYAEYLRLMVVRKLLVSIDKRLTQEQTLDVINRDDMEVCNYCSLLLEDRITDEQIIKLDEIIIRIWGKNILAVGTEQIFFLWKQEEEDLRSELKQVTREISSYEVDITALSSKSGIEGLSREENVLLASREAETAARKKRRAELKGRLDDLTYMIGATEGLLRVYEQREDNPAKISVASEVAQIIVDWHRTDTITQEQRERTEIFARMHLRSAQERSAAIFNEMA